MIKTRLLTALLGIASLNPLWSAESTRLSALDNTALTQRAQTVQRAFDAGDADSIIRYTHPIVIKFFGSREKFETTTRQAVKALAGKLTIEKTEWGTPSPVYVSGSDEVCFLPKTSIARVGEKRARSVGFLIAARQKGTGDWLFLDSASLRKDPAFLWKIFPELPKDVVPPPNTVEVLK